MANKYQFEVNKKGIITKSMDVAPVSLLLNLNNLIAVSWTYLRCRFVFFLFAYVTENHLCNHLLQVNQDDNQNLGLVKLFFTFSTFVWP